MNFSAHCMEGMAEEIRTPYLPACEAEKHVCAEKIPHQKLENIDHLFYENKSQARIQLFSATQSQGQYELEDLSAANAFAHLYTAESSSDREINDALQWYLQKMTAENSLLVRLNDIFPTREQIDILNASPANIIVLFSSQCDYTTLPIFYDSLGCHYNLSTRIYFKNTIGEIYQLFPHQAIGGKSAAKHFSTAS